MKNVQDTSKSLEVLAEAIQTESQKKGKATLYQIAKEGKTFKIIEFVKRENQVNETLKLNWIAFTFSSDLLGKDVIMEASIILFRKNLYDLNDNTKVIPTTNKGALGTLAAKLAFEKNLSIKPKEIDCYISVLNENGNLIKEKSKELFFEILEQPKTKK